MPGSRPQPLEPPSDPWAATAPVIDPTAVFVPEPQVIFIERPRKRRWPWVLLGGVGLLVVCCVGAMAFWTPISKEYPARLQVPEAIGAFEREDDPEVTRMVTELVRTLREDQNADDAVAAVLVESTGDGDDSTPRRIVVLGATRLVLDPAGELEKAINGAARGKLRDTTRYPQLGGNVACANSEDDENTDVVICAWVDHGSVGAGIFYGRWTLEASATMLRDIREAIVHRDG